MELCDSKKMRRYRAEDFYEEILIHQLGESGFLDGLYR